jgi:hypothetical protein
MCVKFLTDITMPKKSVWNIIYQVNTIINMATVRNFEVIPWKFKLDWIYNEIIRFPQNKNRNQKINDDDDDDDDNNNNHYLQV